VPGNLYWGFESPLCASESQERVFAYVRRGRWQVGGKLGSGERTETDAGTRQPQPGLPPELEIGASAPSHTSAMLGRGSGTCATLVVVPILDEGAMGCGRECRG